MHRHTFISLLLAAGGLLCGKDVYGQQLKRQTNISRMGVKPGNYSGITHYADNLYAVVSDKDDTHAFSLFHIIIDPEKGKVKNVEEMSYGSLSPTGQSPTLSTAVRDAEAICYRPSTQTFFVACEANQRIVEYDKDGHPTGKELKIPPEFGLDGIQHNKGFESLTYNASTHRFWTTTEAPLLNDREQHPLTLRLQSFDEQLAPAGQFLYQMDPPRKNKHMRDFAHGVSELLALDDGRLIVLERELLVTPHYLGSYCTIKLYVTEQPTIEGTVLQKQLITQFTTHLRFGQLNLANYEGMCLGPQLNDGRQTLLLINDSQNRMGNRFYRLKDYLKVVMLQK